MALKLYCDRCKKEIPDQSKNYRKVYFMFCEDGDTEEWDFCPDCFMSVKRSVINNLTEFPIKQIQEDKNGILYHHYCIKCGWDWWSDKAFPNRCSKCDCELT